MSKVYSNPLSITSQISFCGLPLRLDSYLGCQFQCRYCFALNRGGAYYWSKIRAADPNYMEKRLSHVQRADESKLGVISQFLKRRSPIHFGGMSDPFQKVEEKYGISMAYLKSLKKHNYPTVISTRSDLPGRDDYFELLKDFENVIIQFSFSTLDDKRSAQIEPYSAKPSVLLRLMEKLSKNNIKVTGRWQPYIINFSESPEDFIGNISSTGIKHLGVEHLKIPLSSSNASVLWPKHLHETGVDLDGEYKKLGAKAAGRELILPVREKIERLEQIKRLVNDKEMTFGCADNELQYLSDTACCCSGVDQFPGFENWFKGQIGYAVRKARDKPTITFSEIASEWRPTGSIKEFVNSDSRVEGINNVDTVLKAKWNSQNNAVNLSSFHRVLATSDFDAAGFRIYQWEE
jgi:DNA repair photolyase